MCVYVYIKNIHSYSYARKRRIKRTQSYKNSRDTPNSKNIPERLSYIKTVLSLHVHRNVMYLTELVNCVSLILCMSVTIRVHYPGKVYIMMRCVQPAF